MVVVVVAAVVVAVAVGSKQRSIARMRPAVAEVSQRCCSHHIVLLE